MKKTIILFLGIIFFILGVFLGYFFVVKGISDEIVADELEIENKLIYSNTTSNTNTVYTNNTGKKVSPNASLIFKTKYRECNHTIKEVVDVPIEFVNLTAEELQNSYSDWEIISFSPKEIVFYKEEEGICNEHYSIKQDDGMISIYKINSNNEEVLFRNTDIAVEYLAEEDKDKLKKGIKVYSKEELNLALEDFE